MEGLPVVFAFFTQQSKVWMCPFLYLRAYGLKPNTNFSISIPLSILRRLVGGGPRQKYSDLWSCLILEQPDWGLFPLYFCLSIKNGFFWCTFNWGSMKEEVLGWWFACRHIPFFFFFFFLLINLTSPLLLYSYQGTFCHTVLVKVWRLKLPKVKMFVLHSQMRYCWLASQFKIPMPRSCGPSV